MEDVILVITGNKNRILPLQSVGRVGTKLVPVHAAGYEEFWTTDTEHYEGEEDPIVILIDSPSFEPKALANQLSRMIVKLRCWHPNAPILQLNYQTR